MPQILVDSSGPFEFFISPGATVGVLVGVPQMLANPSTGATDTLLVYWEPWPNLLEQSVFGQDLFTMFTYTQAYAWDPTGDPQSPDGADLESWKFITNPGPQEQSFVIFLSVLP